MKLYDYKSAPNPRRVRIFLAEKGLEVPMVQVDIPTAENRKPPYTDKNPMGGYFSTTVAIEARDRKSTRLNSSHT